MKIKQLLLVPLLALSCTGPQSAPGPVPGAGSVVIADRLSNQRVNAFAEDADGHIWIGTSRGLNKYSIQEYHQYFCADDTLGLPDNQVTALYSNAAGQLWIGTANGAARRTSDGKFRRIPMEGDTRNITEIVRLTFKGVESLLITHRPDLSRLKIVPVGQRSLHHGLAVKAEAARITPLRMKVTAPAV